MEQNQQTLRRSGVSEAVLLVLIVVLIGMAVAYFFNEAQTPFYRATVQIAFRSKVSVDGVGDPNLLRGRLLKHAENFSLAEFLQTVVVSESVQKETLAGPGNEQGTWLDRLLSRTVQYNTNAESLVRRTQDHLAVTIDPVGSLVTVSVLDPNPDWAESVVTVIPEKYKAFLDEHSSRWVEVYTKIKGDASEQLKKIWAEQNSLKVRLEDIDKTMRIAEKSIPSWITNAELSVINNQLIQKTLAYQKRSPRSLEARELDLEIQALKKEFDAKLEFVRADLSARIEDLNQQEQSWLAQRQGAVDEPLAGQNEDDEREFISQVLEFKGLDPSTHGEEMTVVAAPLVSPRSAEPDKLFNLFVGLFVGLGTAFLFIAGRAIFSNPTSQSYQEDT